MYDFTDTVTCSEVDGELVVLDAASGLYYGLDAIGARMVAVLQTSANLEEAAGTLAREYDAPVERLREDLHALAKTLASKGLVRSGG
ncbi:MAG: PqqD family protein [Spirochaetota bacterium]